MELSGPAFVGGTNPYRYTGKEWESDLDLGLYDFGARWYDPAAGRFTGIDVLAEKYYSISPFAYVANNPVKFIDPEGQSIRIYYQERDQEGKNTEKYIDLNNRKDIENAVKNSNDNAFVSQVIESLEYLLDGADPNGVIDGILGLEEHADIKEQAEEDKGNSPSAGKKFEDPIIWDPEGGLLIIDNNGKHTGESQSPAIGLMHELGHKCRQKYDKRGYKKDRGSSHPFYRNRDEKQNIETIETASAAAKNEGVRKNAGGVSYRTRGPTTRVAHPDQKKYGYPVKE